MQEPEGLSAKLGSLGRFSKSELPSKLKGLKSAFFFRILI
jgi:hypothetical protein